VIYRTTRDLSVVNIGQFGEFESLLVRPNSKSSPVIIAHIYRPPGLVTNASCDEFSDVLEQFLCRKRYVTCVDMNCPDLLPWKIDDNLEELISRFNLKPLLMKPTHEAGNLLDLIIVPDTNNDDVKDVSIYSLCFCDQSLVRCRLAFGRQQPALRVNYSYRPIKQIDVSSFRSAVLASQLYDASVIGSFIIVG
jgi:hypothetical protein